MAMVSLVKFINGEHEIVVKVSKFLGSERILYDGILVSKGFSIFCNTHHFSVFEEGEKAEYIVKLRLKFWLTYCPTIKVIRNGKTILRGYYL